MNYTYLESSPYSSAPVIVLSTSASSTKTSFLQSNPRVALLVHDWVSSRPRRTSTTDSTPQTSLAALLTNLNSAQVGSISASINGVARFVAPGTEEERFYKEQHVSNNSGQAGHGEGEAWIPSEGEEGLVIVVVEVTGGRIADWEGGVRDWKVGTMANGEDNQSHGEI